MFRYPIFFGFLDRIKEIWYNQNVITTYTYSYDANGNITQISSNTGGTQYRYTYDDLGQLIREDNRPLNKTYVYSYDTAGNILNKQTYTFTLGALTTTSSTNSHVYGNSTWGDLLTRHNYDDIIYDEIGNPLKKGFQISGNEFEFGYEYERNGRQLTAIKYFDMFSDPYYMSTVEFTYNADGIRTSKTVNGVEHKYYLDGSQILAETWTENGVEYFLLFLYDEAGSPIALRYRTSAYAADVYDTFFYEKNLQGDIVGVYNSSGTKIGTYNYDAWGYHTTTVTGSSTLERSIVQTYNPFRYRGYYYDTQTSLYYLQSRYYDPAMMRFINADGYINGTGDILGYNMFAYCGNDPIQNVDYHGTSWKSFWNGLKDFGENCIKAAVVVVAVGVAVLSIGASVGGTIMSGGAGAATIPAAVAIAAECLVVAGAIVTTTGVVAVATADVGSSITNMIGENGSKTPSKTTWRGKKGVERLDVENPNPGQRDGQIHYHDESNNPYMYDFKSRQFRNPSRRLNDLLTDKNFLNGMKKAFSVLGEIW